MSEHPRYELRSVADFQALPPDKLRHCVEDFLLWLLVIAEAPALFGPSVKCTSDLSVFTWIDDGKHDANFKVTFDPHITAFTIRVEPGGETTIKADEQ